MSVSEFLSIGSASISATASTCLGKLRGLRESGVEVFRGIPYGKPTSGMARFAPPATPEPWLDVRDAVAFGDRCPQMELAMGGVFSSWTDSTSASEDCLRLNVWTPDTRSGERRPVMVWLHSGGVSGWSASMNVFDGANLARKQDVVVVTVNHRLNVFGYLYLGGIDPSYAEAANVGQLDLVAALSWVRDNIAGFGGDPGNVTIFGESGGGAKVAALLSMPSAEGLFHRAIMQSGFSKSGFGGGTQTPAQATAITRDLMALLGLGKDDIAALRASPVDRILTALTKMTGGSPIAGPYLVADGKVIPEVPFENHAPRTADGIPIMIGHTATETTVLFPPSGAFSFDWEQVISSLRPRARSPEKLVAEFRALHPQMGPTEVYFAVTTAATVAKNARNIADIAADGGQAKIYSYLLNWRTPAEEGRLGAPHALDLPLVFDTVASSPAMIGGADAEAQQVADAMSGAWAAFARTGSPNRAGLSEWPRYDVNDRWTMVFDLHCEALRDPLGREQSLIAEYF